MSREQRKQHGEFGRQADLPFLCVVWNFGGVFWEEMRWEADVLGVRVRVRARVRARARATAPRGRCGGGANGHVRSCAATSKKDTSVILATGLCGAGQGHEGVGGGTLGDHVNDPILLQVLAELVLFGLDVLQDDGMTG